jgi:hypothetical protein
MKNEYCGWEIRTNEKSIEVMDVSEGEFQGSNSFFASFVAPRKPVVLKGYARNPLSFQIRFLEESI